jgi:alpha-tubulin suppressor-like RCC1 family protein
MRGSDRGREIAVFTAFAIACGSGGANPPATAKSASSSVNEVAAKEPPAGPPKDVDCGDFTTCATSNDGVVRCWGKGKDGQLGDGAGDDKNKPVAVPSLGKASKTAIATHFGCALLEDKTVKCWGSGKIANDGKAYTRARPTAVAGVEGVEDLVASGAIACARSASSVSCWGADASTIGSAPKGTFSKVAVGFTHACALDKDGAPVCWGSGDWDGKGAYAKVALKGAIDIATGDRHACVVTKDKKVSCWGHNDAGQLGTKPDADAHKKPAEVPGTKDVVKLAAGEASTCALSSDGGVRCWGQNGEGELGLGSRSSDERPTKVSALSSIESMCIASAHGCALTKQSKILCWGANASGQLGDGTKERHPAPTAIAW